MIVIGLGPQFTEDPGHVVGLRSSNRTQLFWSSTPRGVVYVKMQGNQKELLLNVVLLMAVLVLAVRLWWRQVNADVVARRTDLALLTVPEISPLAL